MNLIELNVCFIDEESNYITIEVDAQIFNSSVAERICNLLLVQQDVYTGL